MTVWSDVYCQWCDSIKFDRSMTGSMDVMLCVEGKLTSTCQ